MEDEGRLWVNLPRAAGTSGNGDSPRGKITPPSEVCVDRCHRGVRLAIRKEQKARGALGGWGWLKAERGRGERAGYRLNPVRRFQLLRRSSRWVLRITK